MGRLANLYLFTYNAAQAFGWTVALIRIVSNVSTTKSVDGAYAAAGDLICLLQYAAFMEVLHAAIGLVPSGVFPILMQWGGRTHFVAAIVCQITEVIRYPQYALNALGLCPNWLTWLRYSAFVVLYPIGAILGEMWLMYQALPYIKKKNIYGYLFNQLPFSYYSFVAALLACYPFLWMKLYLYMLKQRQSKLGKRGKGKKGVAPKLRIE